MGRQEDQENLRISFLKEKTNHNNVYKPLKRLIYQPLCDINNHSRD
jgi:hypothetical protein